MSDKTIFGAHSTRPQILTTCNAILRDLRGGFPPVADLPEGMVRIRLRADEIAPVVCVKTPDAIRAFLINIDSEGKLSRGPEVAANYRAKSSASVLPSSASPATVTP